MIETVVSANMLIGEVMRVKKNHLAPDFPTGNEKRLCIVSGIHGDEVAGQYICYELIRRIKRILTSLLESWMYIHLSIRWDLRRSTGMCRYLTLI